MAVFPGLKARSWLKLGLFSPAVTHCCHRRGKSLGISLQIPNIVIRESDIPRLDFSVSLKDRAGRFREGSCRPVSIRQLRGSE